MSKSLVIVESPAKARTIARFLGVGYTVMPSMGHVRDLESRGLAVDVDHHFKPSYEVHESKRGVIHKLRAALKDADALYLATDEDREGEAISWHLIEVLKPRVPVRRMVFDEITREAIRRAIAEPRELDTKLVDAQESRRIVDRLFGYPVSEVCWRKIRPRLSAGRVQSPAVRLVVERERERMAFVRAGYWSVEAEFPTEPPFKARLVTLGGAKVAEGRDFDSAGRPREGLAVLDEVAARRVVEGLAGAGFSVAALDTRPYTQRPRPPFTTSTLQQVGGSRLRMSAARVMRVAQRLYEEGYISYMRTDSTTLSETALGAARRQIEELYGAEYAADAPRRYATKAKGAQEAHEAIRPAGESFRTPQELAGELSGADLELYRIIWQRTLASQMPDARGSTATLRIAARTAAGEETEWSASGRTITFPGFLRVYGFAGDDAEQADEDTERLPQLEPGEALRSPTLEPEGHSTQPPARYTEATLVKALEEKGIGRPSTYAPTMTTIEERGYVWKKGTALVPTADAFAVTALLEGHFRDLVAYDFTAKMENDLDEIAAGEQKREPWLKRFWFGNGSPGLRDLYQRARDKADPAEINTIPIGADGDGNPIVVRNGRYGPFVKRGEQTASLPPNLPLDEVTVEMAIRLLEAPKGDKPIGTDPASGLPVYAKPGRFGPYVQLGDGDTLPEGQKPKTASLFQHMSLETLTLEDALRLLSLPRVVGLDPAGVEITAQNGRHGPYLKRGADTRSLPSEAALLTVTVEEALALLAAPKLRGRGARVARPPLRELGPDPASGLPMVIRDGRFGAYISDGHVHVTVPRSETVEEITPERAAELLAEKREREPGTGRRKVARRRAAGAKKAASRQATAGLADGAPSGPATRARGGSARRAGAAARKTATKRSGTRGGRKSARKK